MSLFRYWILSKSSYSCSIQLLQAKLERRPPKDPAIHRVRPKHMVLNRKPPETTESIWGWHLEP